MDNFDPNKEFPQLPGHGTRAIPTNKKAPHVIGPPIEGSAAVDIAGVFGVSDFPNQPAVYGSHMSGGIGVFAEADANGIGIQATGGQLAGLFQGNVQVTGVLKGPVTVDGDILVTGDISLINGDCAEEFDVVDGLLIEPGTVMVLADDGSVCPSKSAYDKRVAGVVSGAGNYRPALILDTHPSSHGRLPVALMGKVYCRVDATLDPIQVGDLLTTSPTEGRAMKASDPARAFGTVIGKALKPLDAGLGLIPILVALQ